MLRESPTFLSFLGTGTGELLVWLLDKPMNRYHLSKVKYRQGVGLLTVNTDGLFKTVDLARHQWVMPIILATHEQRSRGSRFEASPGR
jgi:hypothetical protein